MASFPTQTVVKGSSGAAAEALDITTYVMPSGLTDGAIYVAIGNGGPSGSLVQTVTWNTSESLTMIARKVRTANSLEEASLWRLLNPTTGNHTVHIACTGGTSNTLGAVVFCLENVHQTTPERGSVATGEGDSASASVTLPAGNSAVGDVILSVACAGSGFNDPSAGTKIEIQNTDTLTGGGNMAASRASGSASDVTFTWGLQASDVWRALAISVRDNGSAGASAALTGTATSSITEADVVAGGKTVILTLTNETYLPAAGTPTYNAATTKGTTAADSAGGGGGRDGDGALTCTFPSSYTPTAGHFALMVVYSDGGSGSVPTDWAEVTGSPWGAGTQKLQAFYKVLAGGESAPVTTISGSASLNSHCANMVIYTGVGSIGAIGTPSNGTGTPMTAGAVTTTADNSIVCALAGRGDNESSSGQTFNGSATGVNERLDGGTAAGNDSQVSMADITIATSGSSSGAASSTTSNTDPWVSVQIELLPSTPFANARAAIRNGLDSAQSEAAGWDAKVKPNIPVGSVVRTSDTVCTITLQAQADYEITAQETIEATIPGAALAGGSPIVATPTFTVDAAAGAAQTPFNPYYQLAPILAQ